MPDAAPPGPTVTLPHADTGDATVTRAPPVGSGFDEEFRRLVRSRLVLVHLLTLAFVGLLAVLEVAIPRGEGDPTAGYWWRLTVPFAVRVPVSA